MIRQTVFALVLGLALAPGIARGPGAQQTAPPPPPSRPPAEIPFSRLVPDAAIPVALEPGAAASADAIWTAEAASGGIVRLDIAKNAADPPIAVGSPPCASLLVAFDSVWVPRCDDRTVTRVDAKTGKVSATLKLPVASKEGRIAEAVGSVWILTDTKGVMSRIDPDSNAAVAEVYLPAGVAAIVSSANALWVTSEIGKVTRVSPHTNEAVETIEAGAKPGRLAAGLGAVWALNGGDGSVTRIDPEANKVVATIPTGVAAGGEIAVGADSVWVSAPGSPIVRIDPRTNRAVQRFVGDGGGAILVAHGSLWVKAGPKLTWRLDPLLVARLRP